jgi:hypothetical protein
MRVIAKKLLAEKNRRVRIHDPMNETTHLNKIAELRQNALDFARDIILEISLPSMPEVLVGRIKGLEDVHEDINQVKGVIFVTATFKAVSGHVFRMDLPIPIRKGELLKPSIMVINSKKYVFSAALVEQIVKDMETTKPKMMNFFLPNQEVRQEQVTSNMYGPVIPSNTWWDSVGERWE